MKAWPGLTIDNPVMIFLRSHQIYAFVTAFQVRFATEGGVCESTLGYVGLEIVRDCEKRETYSVCRGVLGRFRFLSEFCLVDYSTLVRCNL